MRIPNFICAGAPKAGTTTLHAMLSRHPDIYLPVEKELHFFDLDENFSRGVEWYAAHFADTDRVIAGEVTPSYLGYDYVAERMATVLGSDLKLLFVLRNPVDRAYSEYQHNRRRGLIPEVPFEEAILWEERDSHLGQLERRYYSFLSRGLYARHLSRYMRHFARDRMLTLITEDDLGEHTQASVARVLAFLGVPHRELSADTWENRGYAPRSGWIERLLHRPNPLRRAARVLVPDSATRQRIRRLVRKANVGQEIPAAVSPELRERLLREYFESDIRELERLLDRSLDTWLGGAR